VGHAPFRGGAKYKIVAGTGRPCFLISVPWQVKWGGKKRAHRWRRRYSTQLTTWGTAPGAVVVLGGHWPKVNGPPKTGYVCGRKSAEPLMTKRGRRSAFRFEPAIIPVFITTGVEGWAGKRGKEREKIHPYYRLVGRGGCVNRVEMQKIPARRARRTSQFNSDANAPSHLGYHLCALRRNSMISPRWRISLPGILTLVSGWRETRRGGWTPPQLASVTGHPLSFPPTFSGFFVFFCFCRSFSFCCC